MEERLIIKISHIHDLLGKRSLLKDMYNETKDLNKLENEILPIT